MHKLGESFITSQYLKQIESYVENNIIPCCKEEYKDFLPLISFRIEEICNGWLTSLKNDVGQGKFVALLDHTNACLDKHVYLDEVAAKLIVNIFVDVVGVKIINEQYPVLDYNTTMQMDELNFLCPDLLPPGRKFFAQCYWTPRNQYLYEATQKRHYQHNPAADGALFLSKAKEGQETDVLIKSKEGDSISVHSLFLKTKSEYFKAALKSGFKEASKEIVFPNYSTKHLNSAIEFIYTGKISDASNHTLSDLGKILEIAHLWQLESLINYSTDLINECLEENQSSLTFAEISQIIKLAYFLDLKEFLVPCLKILEDSENALDWSQIESEYYADLHEVAITNSFEKVKGSLKQNIEQLLKQVSIVEIEDQDPSDLTQPDSIETIYCATRTEQHS